MNIQSELPTQNKPPPISHHLPPSSISQPPPQLLMPGHHGTSQTALMMFRFCMEDPHATFTMKCFLPVYLRPQSKSYLHTFHFILNLPVTQLLCHSLFILNPSPKDCQTHPKNLPLEAYLLVLWKSLCFS